MKTVFGIVALAIAALYFYNNRPPQAEHVGKDDAATSRSPIVSFAGASTQSSRSQTATNVPQITPKIVEAATTAPRSTSIVIAPMPKIGLKTGPNAQTDLKTGPNAQNDWTAPNRWKTGPNAQTDLTLKRSW